MFYQVVYNTINKTNPGCLWTNTSKIFSKLGKCIFVANMIIDNHDEEEKFRIIHTFSSSACTFCVCAYIIV